MIENLKLELAEKTPGWMAAPSSRSSIYTVAAKPSSDTTLRSWKRPPIWRRSKLPQLPLPPDGSRIQARGSATFPTEGKLLSCRSSPHRAGDAYATFCEPSCRGPLKISPPLHCGKTEPCGS